MKFHKKRAESAKKLGVNEIFDPSDSKSLQELIKTGVDTVIDCTGVPASILNSFEITRKEVMILGLQTKNLKLTRVNGSTRKW